MKLIDKYILNKFFGTFFVLLLLFIPIGITVDVAEKIDNMLRNNAKLDVVLEYYLNFTVHFANLLFPLFGFSFGHLVYLKEWRIIPKLLRF